MMPVCNDDGLIAHRLADLSDGIGVVDRLELQIPCEFDQGTRSPGNPENKDKYSDEDPVRKSSPGANPLRALGIGYSGCPMENPAAFPCSQSTARYCKGGVGRGARPSLP